MINVGIKIGWALFYRCKYGYKSLSILGGYAKIKKIIDILMLCNDLYYFTNKEK